MRRVLIFTYYWPPAGGPGVQRFLKFARYLREFNWEPVIITPENGSYPYTDDSLAADIPEGIKIVKTETLEPFAIYNRLTGKKGKQVSVAMIGFKESKNPVQKLAKWVRANLFIPDARIGWKKYAVKAGRELLKDANVKAIITTGPPHSTHLTGLQLKNETGIPWIADFRDPWTTVYYNAFFNRGRRAEKKDQQLENTVLSTADHTVVISHGMQDEFKDRVVSSSVIFNGYDEADLYDGEPDQCSAFHLSYIGNMKPNQHVPALWKAAAELISADEEFSRDFRFHFTGILDPAITGAFAELGISDHVITDGFVAHKEATRRMYQAGLLLFVIPDSENNHRIITGKIFEYIASGTRIFAVGPAEGDASRILRETGAPEMHSYTDLEGMKRTLKQAHRDWLAGNRYPLKDLSGNHTRFSRRALTGKLAGILDQLTVK